MTTATIDDRQRVRIPDAKPGQVVRIEAAPDGGWRLKPIDDTEPRRIVGKMVQKGSALIFEAKGIAIDPEAIARAVSEERDSRS